MNNSGQIFCMTSARTRLARRKKALTRAGIQNAQIIQADDTKLKKLKKKMDWVLVDAPCSGTGTLRRNPDMKWKFNLEMLNRLIGQQRTIFEKALSFMKPDGRIIYGTCSLLPQENEQQLDHFIKTYDLKIEGEIFQVFSFDRWHGCFLWSCFRTFKSYTINALINNRHLMKSNFFLSFLLIISRRSFFLASSQRTPSFW